MALLHTIKDEAFELIRDQSKTTAPATDLSIQQYILERFDKSGLTCEAHPPIVAVNENAANGTTVGITASASDADATTNEIHHAIVSYDSISQVVITPTEAAEGSRIGFMAR